MLETCLTHFNIGQCAQTCLGVLETCLSVLETCLSVLWCIVNDTRAVTRGYYSICAVIAPQNTQFACTWFKSRRVLCCAVLCCANFFVCVQSAGIELEAKLDEDYDFFRNNEETEEEDDEEEPEEEDDDDDK